MKIKNTLLINAIDYERGELRAAVIIDGSLDKLIIENETMKINKGNIYLATISSDVPSLDAYFVSFGSNKHGFLPYNAIAKTGEKQTQKKYKVNDKVLVQIDKEERGTKGAALTNEIAIAGQYLVAMPLSPTAIGISKSIEGEKRIETKAKIDQLNFPKGMGIILRTAAQNKPLEDLQSDLNSLIYVWEQILASIEHVTPPALIYQEFQGIYKILRDTLKENIEYIVVDNQELLDKVKEFLKRTNPEMIDKAQLHSNKVPIFTHHQIEDIIESLYSREVQLKSGGKLFIDKTEALYAIDVNSAQATSASTIETTAYETNLEAVERIAQLLQLRDINGLIIIDLIDMNKEEHKSKVMATFNKHLKKDRSKLQISEISKLGLIELSRQRTRPSLAETHLVTCPQCLGRGFIRSTESFSYSLIHIIEQHAIHGKTAHLLVQVPVEVGTYLCNEKRETLISIEKRQGVTISIISNPHFTIPKYQIKRIRTTDSSFSEPSYNHIQEPSDEMSQESFLKAQNKKKKKQAPLVTFQSFPPSKKKGSKTQGLIGRILKAILGEDKQKKDEKSEQPQKRKRTHYNNNAKSGPTQKKSKHHTYHRNSRRHTAKRNPQNTSNSRRGPELDKENKTERVQGNQTTHQQKQPTKNREHNTERPRTNQTTSQQPRQTETGNREHATKQTTSQQPRQTETGNREHATKQTTSQQPRQSETGNREHATKQTTSQQPRQTETGNREHATKQTTSQQPRQTETGNREHATKQTTSQQPRKKETGNREHATKQTTSQQPRQTETGNREHATKQTTSQQPRQTETGNREHATKQTTSQQPRKKETENKEQ